MDFSFSRPWTFSAAMDQYFSGCRKTRRQRFNYFLHSWKSEDGNLFYFFTSENRKP